MSKVLVTGGAGFIGSHIATYLVDNNYHVRVIDNLSTGNKNNLNHLFGKNNFEFMYGDITNLEFLRKACDGMDVICHQAAIGSVPRSINDPLTSHNSNVNGFLNLILVAKEKNIKRIVYASSSSVYGDSEILPKSENVIGNQKSPYAITKYIDELYGNLFSKLYGLECIGFRYFNIFGPRQDPNGPYAAVIPKFINFLKQDKSPTINGDGTFSRDFTYVDNAVRANVLGLFTTNSECFGQIFNIGAGGNVSILEMYEKIQKMMNKNIDPNFGPERNGDIPHSHADISKARKLLEYYPLVSFDDGLKRTVEYFMFQN